MKTRLIFIVILLLFVVSVLCMAQHRRSSRVGNIRSTASPKYIGCWSDGSHGVLFVTAHTIKFGDRGKWVKYVDVTENPDGKLYLLRLFNLGDFNFLSNVVSLSLDEEKMQMTLYDSLKDFSRGKNSGWDTWYKDKCRIR